MRIQLPILHLGEIFIKLKQKKKNIPFDLIVDLNVTHCAGFNLQETFGVTLVWNGDSFRPRLRCNQTPRLS